MDSAESKEDCKQSKVQVEMTNKETDSVTERSNSSSSYASDLSEEFSLNNNSNSNSAIQSKTQNDETQAALQLAEISTPVCLSRVQSSSKNSSRSRLSGLLGNHDPNRIPVSIFSGRPSNPAEWSIASTESLFSIHVGNNSFSRDHFNFQNKSGELMMMSAELTQYTATMPHYVEAARVESKKENTGNGLGVSWASNGAQNLTISSPISTPTRADHRKEVLTPVDEGRGRNSASYPSDDSISSGRSFKFPVLSGDGAAANNTVATDSKTQQPQNQAQEHQSHETTSPSPTVRAGWFSCFSWCSRR